MKISDIKLYRRLCGGIWRYIPAHNVGPKGLNLPFSTLMDGEWVQISPAEEKKIEPKDENYL